MNYDAIVIGAGPGGYYTACNCAKNGIKTAIIEKDKIGGVCLNIGCIPTKALIHIAKTINVVKKDDLIMTNNFSINRTKISEKAKTISENVSKGIEFLFKKNNVDVIKGKASIIDNHTILVKNRKYTTKNIIIATGSNNINLSSFINVKTTKKSKVITSTEALFLNDTPSNITILGGGAIGIEFAYIFNAFNSDVTIIEQSSNILPNIDIECSKTLERVFKRKNIKIITDAKITKIEHHGDLMNVRYNKKETENFITTDIVLNALGRKPNTTDINLEKIQIDTQNGYIKTNKWMQTSIPNIYAVGDVVYESPLLAHVAYDEARTASEHILNKKPTFTIDYNYIPFCIYSEPQIASFGLTERQAIEKNINVKIIKTFFKSSGKAQAICNTDGFVKLVINTKNDKILGAHICGSNATEIIHELLLLSKLGLKLKELTDTMHAHPTLSESIVEAAKNYYGLSLH